MVKGLVREKLLGKLPLRIDRRTDEERWLDDEKRKLLIDIRLSAGKSVKGLSTPEELDIINQQRRGNFNFAESVPKRATVKSDFNFSEAIKQKFPNFLLRL